MKPDSSAPNARKTRRARARRVLRRLRPAPFVLLLVAGSGCFSERPFPIRTDDYRAVSLAVDADPGAPRTTRGWLRMTQARINDLLPDQDPPALASDELVAADGAPVDVLAHFRLKGVKLTSVWCNLQGLEDSAQVTGPDTMGQVLPPPWPGFEDIWIPIGDGLEQSARIGYATRDGRRIEADCVIILPGLFGDNMVQRTRTIAEALRWHGLHVVALETRGFGRMVNRYPDLPYTFATLEAGDLVEAARWLESQPHIRRTGAVGVCWSANQILVAALHMSRSAGDPSVSERLAPHLRPPLAEPVLQAGVIAFSPVLRFEEIIAGCEQEWTMLQNPFLNGLQSGVRRRSALMGYPESNGSLRTLIEHEFARSELNYPGAVDDGLDYLRLMMHGERPAGAKFEQMRIPVLIVQAANDPLTSAQNVADLMATCDNPNVAAIVVAGGGHVGFQPYARSWFYSLLLNYFDPQNGVARFLGD